MKKLNWYDIGETIIIKEDDHTVVNECVEKDIEMTYDENTFKVYSEDGFYIADIVEIKEDQLKKEDIK